MRYKINDVLVDKRGTLYKVLDIYPNAKVYKLEQIKNKKLYTLKASLVESCDMFNLSPEAEVIPLFGKPKKKKECIRRVEQKIDNLKEQIHRFEKNQKRMEAERKKSNEKVFKQYRMKR